MNRNDLEKKSPGVFTVLSSKKAPSFDAMNNVMKNLLLQENIETTVYDPKILIFKNAVQAKKIVKEKDIYILYLPDRETEDDNIITLSLKDGFIDLALREEDEVDIDKGLNLNHIHGDIILPYVQSCMVSIYAENAKSLYLPDLLEAWEIKTNASIVQAPKLRVIQWNFYVQNIRECDVRSLEVVNGIIYFPSLRDIALSVFVFAEAPIELKGISFKKEHHIPEYDKESLFKEMIPFFIFDNKSEQLEITPNEDYLFVTEHQFFGICGTPVCIRPNNSLFWNQVSPFGEIAEHLSVFIFTPKNLKIEEASLGASDKFQKHALIS